MNRNLTFVWLAVVALALSACKGGSSANQAGEAQAVNTPAGTQLPLNLTASSLAWLGAKATGSTHNGTINITEGYLIAGGDAFTGGKFTIDMSTIKVLDLQGEMAGKLEGHLRASDFFLVDSFPTAVFEISSVAAAASDSSTHTITGNLTLRGVTKSISFPAKVAKAADGSITAEARFAIDRTQWGVQYGSSLVERAADKIISNDILFTVKVVTSAPAPAAAPAS
jgi:polyisoprenoid-binding protein YceI